MLAGAVPPVVEIPELGSLVAGIPLTEVVADGEHPLLGARLLLISPSAAEHGIESVRGDGVEQGGGLQRVSGLPGRLVHPPGIDRVLHPGHDELDAEAGDVAVAVRDDLVEVVAGVDVHDRERDAARPAGLGGEVQHHDGVLAAGEQQHRTLELADHLAQDVDRLVLEVGEPGSIDLAEAAGPSQHILLAQQGEQPVDRVVDGAVARVDAKLGMGRFLVVAVDTGQAAQITGPLPGVETLHVAHRAHLDRRRHVDLEQRNAGLVVGAAHRVAGRVRNGDTTAARTSTPWRASRAATQPIRATLTSRSAREYPRSGDSTARTSSPSSTSTAIPSARRRSASAAAIVDFPALGSPVSHRVAPTGRARSRMGSSRVSGSSRGHGCPLRRGPARAGGIMADRCT